MTQKAHEKAGEKDLARGAKHRAARAIVLIIACAATLVGGSMFAMNAAHLSLFFVSGSSMQPELNNGDIAVLKYQKEVKKGQTVVFKEPNKWKSYNGGFEQVDNYFIKQVAAIPGDTVNINSDEVDVNGEVIVNFKRDNYRCPAMEEKDGERAKPLAHTLEQSEIFVLGKNKDTSFDSLRVFCNFDKKDTFLSQLEVAQLGDIVHVFRLGRKE